MARILVVDDDAAVRSTIARLLRALGHETDEADGARDLMSRLAAAKVDAVLLDVIMPRKSGIELAAEIRRRDRSVRIFAMSGGGRTDNRALLQVATSFGADDAITKPFGLDEIDRFLTGHGLPGRAG